LPVGRMIIFILRLHKLCIFKRDKKFVTQGNLDWIF
jgi:hypothetical protein